jgi:hypothetical protein
MDVAYKFEVYVYDAGDIEGAEFPLRYNLERDHARENTLLLKFSAEILFKSEGDGEATFTRKHKVLEKGPRYTDDATAEHAIHSVAKDFMLDMNKNIDRIIENSKSIFGLNPGDERVTLNGKDK